jgi:hypothetical protein
VRWRLWQWGTQDGACPSHLRFAKLSDVVLSLYEKLYIVCSDEKKNEPIGACI